MLIRCIQPILDPDPSRVICLLDIKKEYKMKYVLNKMAYLSEIEVNDILCKVVFEFESDHSYSRKGLNQLCNKFN